MRAYTDPDGQMLRLAISPRSSAISGDRRVLHIEYLQRSQPAENMATVNGNRMSRYRITRRASAPDSPRTPTKTYKPLNAA